MEFILILPLAFIVLVAGMQVVSLTQARLELVGAVREGARVAATTPDPAKAVEAVQAALDPGLRDRTRISVSRPAVVGSPATVSAVSRYRFGPPFPDDMGVDIKASASMLVER